MAEILTSIHGHLLGLDKDGNLVNQYGQIYSLDGEPVATEGGNYYVSSVTGSSNASGTSPQSAVATIAQALALVTANQGDNIYLLPDHAETITGIGGLEFDIAGVSVIGLGNYNQRARILMDGADTVTALISAADVLLQNIVFAAGHADVATCIDVTATGAKLIGLEFVDNIATENFVTPIKATGTDNTADSLTIIACKNLTSDAAAEEFLEVTGDIAFLTVTQNMHFATGGTASPLVLQAGAKNTTFADIGYNKVQHAMTAGDLLIDNGGATNTGLIYNNYVGNLDVTTAQEGGAATGIQFFENLYTSTSVASGALVPVADTPLS